MDRKSALAVMLAMGAAGVVPVLAARQALAEGTSSGSGMMGDGMMGHGVMGGMMDSGTDSASRSDMGLVMQLFENHHRISRYVDELSNGVRTVTESDDARVAGLLQAHVARMYARIENGQVFAMMSRTLPTMFREPKAYTRRLEIIPKGVAIEETSRDPAMVSVLHEHAREVTGFVEGGMMACMMGGIDPPHTDLRARRS